jgi:hypothetical protein
MNTAVAVVPHGERRLRELRVDALDRFGHVSLPACAARTDPALCRAALRTWVGAPAAQLDGHAARETAISVVFHHHLALGADRVAPRVGRAAP